MLYTTFDSPLGPLLAVGDGHTLHGLYMQKGRTAIAVRSGWQAASEPFAEVRAQLGEYFAGDRQAFDVPLAPAGSPFQRPCGARSGRSPTARRSATASWHGGRRPVRARAVGVANGHNPVAVIVPCHRVIGADGSLTGYGGGLERKRLLLELESGVLALGVA